METLKGMNHRVQKLRHQSESTEPKISIERAKLVTEAYKKYYGKVSTPVLRALTFKHLLENKKVVINEDELIIGERGPGPQQTPTYPELCCHTVEDFEVVDKREKISFAASEEVKQIQQDEIIPYWTGKSMRDKIFDEMSDEWKDCYEAGIFTEFMEQRAPGHTVAGDKIYQKGFLDLKAEIEEKLNELDYFNDSKAYDKGEELKAMSICVDALINYAKRHADKAQELCENESDETRREELKKISQVCNKIPAHAPQNFWEALQYYWFVHLGVITELNTWDAFSPGRLDQHLNPFYEHEITEGLLTRDEAKELLECFWIKFNNQPAPPKVGTTLQESGTYTDFANIGLGGVTPEGADGVNDVTYLILEVIDEMRLLQPSTNVQVSKKNPDYFVKKAGKVIKGGWGQPSVFNADAVVKELLYQGKSLLDARCGGTSGCVETGAFGKESYILTGYFNLTKVLEVTFNQGIDPNTGKQIGLCTKSVHDYHNFDELLEAFDKQLKHFIDIKIRGNNVIERLYAQYMPSPFLSLIIDDCISSATDYNCGGARYNTKYIQGVGIGSITDSLTAIKYHIFDNETYTWDKLMSTIDDNFEGNEELRQTLINKTPKYGNDNDYADDIMVDVFNKFYKAVDGRPTITGGVYRINMLPTTCHVYFGSVIGATSDGRFSRQALSEGISPVQGRDTNGPTAVIKSVAKMDHIKTGGTLLNQKFTPKTLEGEKGMSGIVQLIRSYFKLDGHHIQFNVVDVDTLKDAQENPDQYKGLIVRVAGYSDYFNNLSTQLQNEIIKRTEQGI